MFKLPYNFTHFTCQQDYVHTPNQASALCDPRTSDVLAGFRKGRGDREQTANISWITEKSKGIPEKHLFLLH